MEFLARLGATWPRSVVAASLVLALLGGWLGAFHLRLDSDTDSLIAPERPFMDGYRSFQREFGDLEGVVIAVDPKGDEAAARAAVDALAAGIDGLARAAPDGKSFIATWAASIAPEEQWRLGSWAASDAELAAMTAEAEALADVARGDLAAHPLVARALAAPRAREYLKAPDGELLFVEVLPVKDFSLLDPVGAPIAAIRGVVDEVRAGHPAVEIGLTGKPVLQHDEMRTANRDMALASAISLAVITVLFVVVFRGARQPLLAVAAFAIATGWTYGAATLLVGHLNLLSSVFMLVLVGAGLDYGVHVLSRYRELRHGLARREASAGAVRGAGPGTLAGAIGSAAVFFGAFLSDFGGLRELGLIAGAGLLCCALAMVTVLPALLVLVDRADLAPARADFGGARAGAPPRRNGVRLALAMLPVAGCLAALPAAIGFESNLLALQSPGLESVRWERRIFEDSASASWFAASTARDVDDVVALAAKAGERAEILRTESILDVIPRETPERARNRATIASAAAGLAAPPADAPAASRAAFEVLRGATLPIREALPAALAPRLVSPGGAYLVRYLPRDDAWEEEPLSRFVDAVRAVDPEATGVPITQLESIRDMRRAFIETSVWALVAVTVVAGLAFRAVLPALLATASVVAGVGVTVALLPLLGSHLNLANFFAVPMLIGLGIDSAIHVIHRVRHGDGDPSPTVRAVAFTALTTAIGFGALVLAEHRGMRSLGVAMAVGSLACMYLACVVLPLALRARTQCTSSGRTPPGSASMNFRP